MGGACVEKWAGELRRDNEQTIMMETVVMKNGREN
jgi:hypothetical protein